MSKDIVVSSKGLSKGIPAAQGESKAGVVLTHEGHYALRVKEMEFAPASTGSGNIVAKAVLQIEDEPADSAAANGLVYYNATVTGVYTRGDDEISRLNESIGKMLESVGKPTSFLEELEKKGDLNLSALARNELIGKKVFASLRSREGDDGKPRTEIGWFITESRFGATLKSGSGHRRPVQTATRSRGQTNGTTASAPVDADLAAKI